MIFRKGDIVRVSACDKFFGDMFCVDEMFSGVIKHPSGKFYSEKDLILVDFPDAIPSASCEFHKVGGLNVPNPPVPRRMLGEFNRGTPFRVSACEYS
jgi:hypothetical protein